MMEHTYESASQDVKRVIATKADPDTAINLCLSSRNNRRICQERLSTQEKSKICLGNDKTAAKCDDIPMFSQRQFLALVPRQIEVVDGVLIGNIHEFYPQNYKLSTEGFSVALYKAKLMNTICAVIRPGFLLRQSKDQLNLPPYIDTGIIDRVIQGFTDSLATVDLATGKQNCSIDIKFTNGKPRDDQNSSIALLQVQFGTIYTDEIIFWHFSLEVFSATDPSGILEAIRHDEYLTILANEFEMYPPGPAGDEYVFQFIRDVRYPGANGVDDLTIVQISRLIKVLFDHGIFHQIEVSIADIVERDSVDIKL